MLISACLSLLRHSLLVQGIVLPFLFFGSLSTAHAVVQLNVKSTGASNVTITSTSGHGGVTDYTKYGISQGAVVNLEAPLWRNGLKFSGWLGCSSTSGIERSACSITMDYNWTVIAEYAPPRVKDAFITTWKTDNPGVSSATSITVPMIAGPYYVDWDNDGTIDEAVASGAITHDFGVAGEYTIGIFGQFDAIRFNNSGDKEKIISLDQWGTARWKSMYYAFAGAKNMETPATDTAILNQVTDMAFMFAGAHKANPYTYHWQVPYVTDMSGMFADARAANPYTRQWDTRSVTNMSRMFAGASSANPDVENWNTHSLTDASQMFQDAVSFDRNLAAWDVSLLKNASAMFDGVALSRSNYEALLIGWSQEYLQTGVEFSGGTSTYCSAEAVDARLHMTSVHSWAISDGGEDCAEIIVEPPAFSWQWEGYDSTFYVYLGAAPESDVWIEIKSDNETEAEPRLIGLNFTPENWAEKQMVSVAILDDPVDDGDIYFNIILEPAISSDPRYDGIDPPDIPLMSRDDDEFSVSVWPRSITTTEAGGQATFSIYLGAAPTEDYYFSITLDDDTEGEVSYQNYPLWIVFDRYLAQCCPGNWNIPQEITVTGLDDQDDDGDITYSIWVNNMSEAGWNFEVPVTNQDDDTAGISVSGISGNTTEEGGQAFFNIELDSRPMSDVTIGLSSNDTTEGTVSPSEVAFTPDTWNIPQEVTVTGVGDDEDDGNTAYKIVTAPAQSTDSQYHGIDPPDVTVMNAGKGFYSVGGNVSGLEGTGLLLQNNGGDDLAITGNGGFSFTTPLLDGSGYAVLVKSQPTNPGQTCTVTNGSGTLDGAAVSNIGIACKLLGDTVFSDGFEP